MSKSEEDYRIYAQDIVESGIKQVKFDPSNVEIKVEGEYFSDYSPTASQRIIITYKDKDLARLMGIQNYSVSWAKTIFKAQDQKRTWDREGIVHYSYVESRLRKKPNVDGEYTENSINKFKERAKARREKLNVEFVNEQIEKLIAEFNEYYADKQRKEVVRVYGDIYAWKWETVEEINDMDIQIKVMEEKLKDLRNKKFDRQCDYVVQFVKDKAEKISEEFKQPIIDAVNEKRAEGYKSPWFR
jgi:hypothetical protein